MKRNGLPIILAVVVALAMLAGGTALAVAGDGVSQAVEEDHDDPSEDAAEGPDVPITGAALEQASAAALDYLGEGRVTGTEVGDEESYYEVEVTLDSGGEVDVQLDEAFNVVGTD